MSTAQLLQKSPSEYELFVLGLWLDWCKTKSYSYRQLQLLMASNALFQWWLVNLRNLEEEFCQDAWPYRQTITGEDAVKLYRKHTQKLGLYYSTPLIKKALTPAPKENK